MSRRRLVWLAGDHHVHTEYSHDGTYTVARQAEAAARHGLGWIVITDHGGPDHAKLAVAATYRNLVEARAALPQLLVFQGLEWNVPGSEHGTVFFSPSGRDVQLLRQFEQRFDGHVLFGERCTDPAFGVHALEGLRWMAEQVAGGQARSALFLVNHPSRRGLVSPSSLRQWHDAAPGVAVGMEGAPGHQAAGRRGESRGLYDKGPTADSVAAYPRESYRSVGGFDWMTATVGGVWDALLSEGRRWWVTANSDSHAVVGEPDSPADARDFWPGAYSRTVVGATDASYDGVMDGLRHGRVWVVHGDLIWSLEQRVGPTAFAEGEGVPLGGRAVVSRGSDVEVRLRIGLPKGPNGSGNVPRLARVDLIAGPTTTVRGRPDATDAPDTEVVRSFDIRDRGHGREVVLRHRFRSVRRSFYVRARGTDGKVAALGSIEPLPDRRGVDPWGDLWFYANPIFVDVS